MTGREATCSAVLNLPVTENPARKTSASGGSLISQLADHAHNNMVLMTSTFRNSLPLAKVSSELEKMLTDILSTDRTQPLA